MYYLLNIVQSIIESLQSWTPMQLLAAAVCTVLLGYIGLMSRLAMRG